MKASWLLAPVLLSMLAAGQPSTNARVQEARFDVSVPLRNQASEAHRRAQATGRAEDLIEAGDLYRRLGEVTGAPAAFDATARAIYTAALSRARREQSLDGVLRVAEAFAALGDRPAVERALAIALSLAAHDPEARADLRAFAARIAAGVGDEATPPGR